MMTILHAITTILFIPILQATTSLIDPSCSHLPTMAEQGRRLIMFCCPTTTSSWFSVKWYKEEWQLSQHDRTGQAVVYNKEGGGVQVDSELSIEGRLVLLNMSESGQGLYKCEVTGPAPVYHTATIMNTVRVVKLPHKPPLVEVEGQAVSCTVQGEANTMAEVIWFIDGYTAPSSWVKAESNRSLITIKQGMLGKVVVRCVARVYQMYWGTAEVEVEADLFLLIQLKLLLQYIVNDQVVTVLITPGCW